MMTLAEASQDAISLNPGVGDVDLALYKDSSGTPSLFVSGSDGVIHSNYGIKVTDDKKINFGDNGGYIHFRQSDTAVDYLVISGSGGTAGGGIVLSGSAIANAGFTEFYVGALVLDDKKLNFGNGLDASSEYDEDGTDELRFAGAAATFEQDVTFDNNVTLGVAPQDVTTATGRLTASLGMNIPDDKKLRFGSATGGDVTIRYDEASSDTLLFEGGDLLVTDDKKLYFGADKDAHIEYDEDGTDELRFAGAAVTFEQDVTFDNDVTLGVAPQDITTTTGRLTASVGMNIPDDQKLLFGSATGGDGFIEFRQSDTAIDYLVISGSTATNGGGIVLSGSQIIIDGTLSGASPLVVSGNMIMSGTQETSGNMIVSGNLTVSGNTIYNYGDFYNYRPDSQAMFHIDAANQRIKIYDDQKLYFGDGLDSFIEFRQADTAVDYLVISGTTATNGGGIVLSGSSVIVDGETTLTGDLTVQGGDIIGPEGANFKISSDQNFSIELDKDDAAPGKYFYVLDGGGSWVHRFGDDGKQRFGANDSEIAWGSGLNPDAYIKFRQSDTAIDYLVISGSTATNGGGIVLSGSQIIFDGVLSGASPLIVSGNMIMSGTQETSGNMVVSGNLIVTGNTIYNYGDYYNYRPDRQAMFHIDAANQRIKIYDDQKLYFGDGLDAHIEYDEDGTNELRFAGAAVTFEQDATFDNNVTLGVAPQDVITTTGRLTASVGMNIPDDKKLRFGSATGGDITVRYDEASSDTLLFESSGLTVAPGAAGGTAVTITHTDVDVPGLAISSVNPTTGIPLFVDHNDSATAAVSPTSFVLDFDKTGVTAAATTSSYTGTGINMLNAAANNATSRVFMTGSSIMVSSSHAAGHLNTSVGLEVVVEGADNNYAALFKSGNVGIGTESPSFALSVTDNNATNLGGSAGASLGVFNLNDNAANAGIFVSCGKNSPGGDNQVTWLVLADGDSTPIAYINYVHSGPTAGFVAASDRRIKTDVAPTKVNALEIINNIPLSEYRIARKNKEVTSLNRIGFIAQDCEAAWPEMVSEIDDKNYDHKLKAIAPSTLVPVLVKAIQELAAEIKVLKEK